MHTAAGQSRKEAQVFSWAQKRSGSWREGAENDNGAWAVKRGVGGVAILVLSCSWKKEKLPSPANST